MIRRPSDLCCGWPRLQTVRTHEGGHPIRLVLLERLSRIGAGVVASLLLVASCGTADEIVEPAAPPTIAAPSTTAAVDADVAEVLAGIAFDVRRDPG